MPSSVAARRYARALFSLAKDAGEIPDVGGVGRGHGAVGEDAPKGLQAAVEEEPLLGERAVGRGDEEDGDEEAEHAESYPIAEPPSVGRPGSSRTARSPFLTASGTGVILPL